jgi:homoserine kinase
MRFTAKAPASSANLGPGFDAIGLALDLWNELTVEPSDEMSVRLDGSDGEMLIERENLSLTAMRILAHEYHQELPPLALTVRAEVPVSRGLGSSAAAIVVGLLAANEVMGLGLGRRELFATAWRMEGHGDNVGAALYGGAILAAPGVAEAICLTVNSSHQLQAVVFIPEMTGATHAARAALPTSIPLVDAAFNVATASSLVAGFLTGNLEAISAGMHDRMHEPYRARLFPHLDPVRSAAREAGAIGASLSGAGPCVLALVCPERIDCVATRMQAAAREIHAPGRVTTLAIAHEGAHIVRE